MHDRVWTMDWYLTRNPPGARPLEDIRLICQPKVLTVDTVFIFCYEVGNGRLRRPPLTEKWTVTVTLTPYALHVAIGIYRSPILDLLYCIMLNTKRHECPKTIHNAAHPIPTPTNVP